MTDDEFDASLVDAAFSLGGAEGWRKVSAASAARVAGLDLARARSRFPAGGSLLKRFGQMADAYALDGAATEGNAKDRLFDLLLRRFDFLQLHRAGVLALLRHVPMEPAIGALLAGETLKSMGWLLEGAGVSARGLRGELRKHGLTAVWAWGIRSWMRDESEDLSATMVAVDNALTRADQIASRFGREDGTPEPIVPEPAEAEPVAADPIEAEPSFFEAPPPPGVPPPGVPGI